MEFTEREMTTAVDVVARQLFAATRPPWRRGDVEAAWDELPRVEKYNRRSVVGETVLPVLQALPDRPTVGERPAFSADELAAAAEGACRSLVEQRTPGAWEQLPERRRRRLVRAAVALSRTALQAMPVRQDPDAPVVPDHL